MNGYKFFRLCPHFKIVLHSNKNGWRSRAGTPFVFKMLTYHFFKASKWRQLVDKRHINDLLLLHMLFHLGNVTFWLFFKITIYMCNNEQVAENRLLKRIVASSFWCNKLDRILGDNYNYVQAEDHFIWKVWLQSTYWATNNYIIKLML